MQDSNCSWWGKKKNHHSTGIPEICSPKRKYFLVFLMDERLEVQCHWNRRVTAAPEPQICQDPENGAKKGTSDFSKARAETLWLVSASWWLKAGKVAEPQQKIPGKPRLGENGQERGGHRDISSQWDFPAGKFAEIYRVLKKFKVSPTQACDSAPQETEGKSSPASQNSLCISLSLILLIHLPISFFLWSSKQKRETRNLLRFWAADGSSRKAVTSEPGRGSAGKRWGFVSPLASEGSPLPITVGCCQGALPLTRSPETHNQHDLEVSNTPDLCKARGQWYHAANSCHKL